MGGSWVPIEHNVAWAEAYLRTKWHLDPSSHLPTIDVGQKLEVRGLCRLFFGGRVAGSPSNTMWPASRPISILSGILIHPAIWPQQTWAKKWGLLCPFLGRGAGSPSNTMSRGQRPTSVPSFILIRLTVWPQYTNVSDRQRGQDRTTVR